MQILNLTFSKFMSLKKWLGTILNLNVKEIYNNEMQWINQGRILMESAETTREEILGSIENMDWI